MVHLKVEEERSFPPTHSTRNRVGASADPPKLKRESNLSEDGNFSEVKGGGSSNEELTEAARKKSSLPGSANRTHNGRQSKDKKAGSPESSSEEG